MFLVHQKEFEARETIAFRWVFEDMVHKDNFLSQYFKNPNYTIAGHKIQCQALGLSFFITETQAKARFEKLLNRIGPDAYEVLGKNIAQGQILPKDGHCNLPDRSGHFTLHPFENSTFEQHFVIITTL